MSEERKRLRLSDLQHQDSVGLVCRKCGCRHFRVVYTRPKAGHVMRLRECRHCGHRIITREQ